VVVVSEQKAEIDAVQWAVRAEDGTIAYASEDVARRAPFEGGWTLNGSPIVAALTRSGPDTEWAIFVPVADFVQRAMRPGVQS
jgi:hypothetical protein